MEYNYIDHNVLKFYRRQTEDIFQYLEGRVNQLIKCSLIINESRMDNIFADTTYPSTVVVYLNNIVRIAGGNEHVTSVNGHNNIMSYLFLSIIHELLHTDQVFDKLSMDTCIDSIEKQIDIETSKFILFRLDDIESRFKFLFNKNCSRFIKDPFYSIDAGSAYERNTIEEYIGNILSFVVFRNQEAGEMIYKELVNPVYENIKFQVTGAVNKQDISIGILMPYEWVVSGATFIIDLKKDGMFITNLNQFNTVVYNTFSRFHTYALLSDLFISNNGKDLLIKIAQKNPMIRPVHYM